MAPLRGCRNNTLRSQRKNKLERIVAGNPCLTLATYRFLAELMERLHVTLFLVFAVFIVQIIILLISSHFFNKAWKDAEHHRQPLQHTREYAGLRAEFVQPAEETPLPTDFHFATYLSLALGDTIAQLVSIPPIVWTVALLMFVYQWFLQGWSVGEKIVVCCCLCCLLITIRGTSNAVCPIGISVVVCGCGLCIEVTVHIPSSCSSCWWCAQSNIGQRY
jgi:hypothetical protein